jgi:hypothetical protein
MSPPMSMRAQLARLIAAGMILSTGSTASAQTRRAQPPRELGRQDSAQIIGLLGVNPGDSVAAIGASSSFLLPELSTAVGHNGHVYVVDWDQTAIQGLQHIIEQKEFRNVTAILGQGHDALLPHPVRRMILVNSYRLLENRQQFFEANRKYLSSDARLAVIDYYRRLMKIGPPVRERVSSHSVMREMRRFGYSLTDRHNISDYQYYLVYRLRPTRT